ncbi:MAG: hypothetical protein QG564_1824 [Campylobacterota bacterium]|nr:hypothetical protein [Campylobacterota bacterium]
MSFIPGEVWHRNDLQMDATGKLRVSNHSIIFEDISEYSKNLDKWNEKVVNGASITLNQNNSGITLNTSTTLSSKAIRQTKQYFKKQVGNSLMVGFSLNFNGNQTDIKKSAGYYDNNNGVYLKLQNGVFSLNLRSKSSGSIIEENITQANFNIDKLDGTGESGLTLDLTKIYYFFFDFNCFCTGKIRCYIATANGQVLFHQFDKFELSNTFLGTLTLPIRYEIEQLGVTNIGTMTHFTSFLAVENNVNLDHDLNTISLGRTTRTIATTISHILSIRPKLIYQGKENRANILPSQMNHYVDSSGKAVLVEIWVGGTVTGGAWTEISAESATEYNITATAFNTTNASKIYSEYIPVNSGGATVTESLQKAFLSLNIDGDAADTMTIVGYNLGTGSTGIYSAMAIKEYH